MLELDPLYHAVLHAGRQAFSGCNTASLNRERIGTVLAAIALPTDSSSFITREILGKSFEERLFGDSEQFEHKVKHKPLTRNQCLAARVTSLPASILARGLGLNGGAFTLDAACASSLYAVKLACDELCFNRADAMLAGGVSRPESLYTQVGFSQLRALSPSGRCAPFDESADGLVVGEGAGILVLKRLEDALRDGDHIYALIKGIGLSNDMRGNLLAPESKGQVRAMRGAYESAGCNPRDIDLIECHGTGTPVGDLTEINSLRQLWGDNGWSAGQCAIGSVKSMIGHLLTGAGAAGMIKTLLAMENQTLPPSLHFKQASEGSPLHNSPFRVQTRAEKWIRKGDRPFRAAVSGFGFGGINAHVVFEEKMPEVDKNQPRAAAGRQSSTVHSQSPPPQPPVAIIGMDTAFGSLKSLKEFQETVLNGGTNIGIRPKYRWKGSDEIAKRHLNGPLFYGGYMDQVSLDVETFHIPPNEIPDILPQQLLMLKVSANAMKDAGLALRHERPRMGVIIGMEFDFEATNFHLRWNLKNSVRDWRKRNRFDLDEDETTLWLESLRDACGPPLTATRTVGALGGIVASRIAREFQFGGPSFGVSSESASGLRALDIGVRLLQKNEIDTILVGAVDLFGDVRSVITSNQTRQFTKAREIRPFDLSADGSLPGEGAAALVLKRLDRAIEDNDRVYAIIKGIGCAGGKGIDIDSPSKADYILSLKRSFKEAGISPDSISFIETHGSGNPVEDRVESEALQAFFARRRTPCAIGSSKPNIGHTGAAAGLASLIKTSLCLYQEIIPPLRNFVQPASQAWESSLFHAPVLPQYWLRDRKEGPRRACSSAMTTDGNCMHVILEAFEYESFESIPIKVMQERKRPLGLASTGLFAIEGNSKAELMEGLDALALHVKEKEYLASKSHFPNIEKVSSNDGKIEIAARTWHSNNRPDSEKKLAISIVAGDISQLEKSITEAQSAISTDTPKNMNGPPGGISYSPSPMGPSGDVAFVFPGSGNHYIGMGRRIGVQWPDILRKMDIETLHLMTQIVPDRFVPWRLSWGPGWEKQARETMISDPLNMIFGQVSYGSLIARLAMDFGIKPSACIGYSLGESAGLFSLGAWADRDEMLKRMRKTDLFSTQLAGPCIAARNAWNVPDDEDVDWCVAAINRPASVVRKIVDNWPTTRLLIVNTPDQSVIGGRKHHVQAAVDALGCEAVFLEGVVTVHCDAARPVADAYKNLHIFPTAPPKGIRFYSCALGRAYDLTSESAASSILEQAISGFDFTAVINQAYRDGVRVFLEMGPHSSCTGMISSILKDKPHTAVSASIRDEDEYLTILKFLGALIAQRIPVNLDNLYGIDAYPLKTKADPEGKSTKKVSLTIGGKAPDPTLPSLAIGKHKPDDSGRKKEGVNIQHPVSSNQGPALDAQYSEMMNTMAENIEATATAHKAFLDFSNELTQSFEKTFALQAKLLESMISDEEIDIKIPVQPHETTDRSEHPETLRPAPYTLPEPAFSREMCMEFAVGAVEKVLGPEFAVVDTYKARVRLPDEPLMLVDRILSVEGEKGSLGSGRLVTEHDVIAGAWYLDGGRAPVCISVEAGQADLFLCAYLGIDLAVKGERTYRLLDAAVEFHRGLPQPGDVIRYHINIDHFTRQGDTFLFFFNFEGYINESHLISMTNGCAGFFTEEEVKNSGGIILTEEDIRPAAGKKPSDWIDLVPVYAESFDDDGIDALRKGNLADCFGELFDNIELADSLRLPGGRMKLIDRILSIDPEGGRYGLGIIRAEADIRPDDWFLTCHFMDDMVMPGTLMYECCAHTLRVFLQRTGWVTENSGVCYEPVVGVKSILKCRGPVTPETQHVHYEIEIKEIGYTPEPYVIADALMYADGHRIVSFKDMSMKMTGITREEIESLWKEKKERRQRTDEDDQKTEAIIRHPASGIREPAIYDRDSIVAFAVGNPSEAFGEPYKVFDSQRKIARLPGPPYSFMDRVVSIEPEAWVLKPDGWIEAEYDVPLEGWYFKADRSGSMPFCVLLEIALQPCGWLAAYLGSALRSENDLKFRNLGGNGILNCTVIPEASTLTMKARMTKISEAADMIIEHFDFQVLQGGKAVYSGDTYFGFFSKEALAQQVGIRGADREAYLPTANEVETGRSHIFQKQSPLSPDDLEVDPSPSLAMPSNALRMIDRIDIYVPNGGPKGLGFIRGIKEVDPDEWFFKAHFFQDPVCPGSLGIESFLQLIKFAALDRWKNLADSHRFELITKKPHIWSYRGQVIPENKKIEIDAVVTEIQETPFPMIQASGFLKVDGLYIYEMKDFGFRLIPI
ncbi:beta-ketoacyl synthase N-terminal-like domain-containing protein [Thermodesulfobacteriota bacterium]